MLEYFSASFLYSFGKDLLKGRFGKKPDPIEVLKIRNKWRDEIEQKLWEFRRKKMGKDVIIHDIDRLDHYPDSPATNKKGISPWFRAGLMGTYERGILLGLDWAGLIQDTITGEWRKTTDAESGETFCLAGKVPYENIVSINWDGDAYYNKPHIYCRFDKAKKQPYEDVVYCRSTEITHIPGIPSYEHYSEVVSFSKVK